MDNSEIKLELDNFDCGAFNLYDGKKKMGTLLLKIDDEKLMAFHTEVAPESRGEGYAKQIFDEMVAHARKCELKVIPICPYIQKQFKQNPDRYRDIWRKIEIKL